jgi:hypothetical protein
MKCSASSSYSSGAEDAVHVSEVFVGVNRGQPSTALPGYDTCFQGF